MSTTIIHTDALASAHQARAVAEQVLRRSELERDQTARALELNVHPADEAARATLRLAYADAAASVAANRDAYERAVSIEHAATVIADAIDDEAYVDHDVVDGLVQLLELRQRRQRDIAPPVSARSRRSSQDVRAPLR
jgi:hypothetical protein